MFKTLHTFSETEVYVDKTVNNLSSLSHEMHSVTIFPKIHEHFCHSHFTICKTLYFLHIFLMLTHCFQNYIKTSMMANSVFLQEL